MKTFYDYFNKDISTSGMLGVINNQPVDRAVAIAIPTKSIHEAFYISALLDHTEQDKAVRLLKEEDATRYCAAHGLARLVIGAVIGRDPARLRFGTQRLGKPYLLGPDRLDFSISHGGDWVAAAVSKIERVGVDVEAEQTESIWQEIAPILISADEAEVSKTFGHLKIWTAKEAALKALGTGFARSPKLLSILNRGANDFMVEHAENLLRGKWCQMDGKHILSVVTDGREPQISICLRGEDLVRQLISFNYSK